ncbi:MAG TPA: adenylate/guanylate cyclase domain-containing protein [Gaiellaceae bacterium]|nr:adenylate/guanylate cyclase domain-containing protein [Gaiellaceae bacterium]
MADRTVERRVVTVLFADLVGFTTLSERLDAEDVALIQDAYFAAAKETVARHGGVLEKFIGDAVMAVFGVPRARDDDAERAVRAGTALIAAVERLNASLDLEPDTLRLRAGVNTGEVVVGEGTAERGPVTGDTVNVAARLQAAAEPGRLVVGDVTALAIADVAELEPLPPLELKGKEAPFRAARVGALHAERSRERALGLMRAPTLGRDRELEQLTDLFGRTTRLTIVAPPGVGKSRLLRELSDRAAHAGAVVLTARLRPDLLSPFEPVAQLLAEGGGRDALMRALGDSPRAAVVAEVLTTVGRPRTDSPVEQEQLFAAWLEGLDALLGEAPGVWLVEDVHWASRDLLAFLERAGTAARPAGRTVFATARPTLLEHEATWATAGEVMHLEPIENADVRELVKALVGDALPEELADAVADRSGGNPLFIEELVRMWASAGVLAREGEGWVLTPPAEGVPLPPTVQAIYAGQLDDLPAGARTAVRRAAVAGRRFPIAALPVLEVDAPDAALDVLSRRGLVAGPTPDPSLGASYAYRHALLRDAGYASLARAERARLHLRLADWLASLDASAEVSVAEVVARHYAASLEATPQLVRVVDDRPVGEIRAAAAEWFERAAGVARSVAAWETAASLAARSVELTPDADRFERARRLVVYGETTASAARVDAALPLLRDALADLRALHAEGDPRAREAIGAAGWALGNLLRSQTRFDAAFQLADELIGELGEPADIPVGLLIVERGFGALNARDDYAAARLDAQRALTIAQDTGDAALELEATVLRTQAEGEAGEDDPSAWDDLARIAAGRGRWDLVASSLRVRAAFDWDDDPAASLPLIDEAEEIARVHGLVESLGWMAYARAEAFVSLGDWDAALTTGLDAVAYGEERDFHRLVVRSWFALRPIAVARGSANLLEQAYPRFAARAGVEPDSYFARIVTTAMHLAFADAGLEPAFLPDVELRLPCFDMDHRAPSWLASVEAVVEAWLAAGELDGVDAALERMRASLARSRPTGLAVATEALLRARLLAHRGSRAEAIAAAQAARDVRAPWWRAKASRLLGEVGGDEAALREAQLLERKLGMIRA